MDDLLIQLAQFLDSSSFTTDFARIIASQSTPFSHFSHPALAVVLPENITQIKKILSVCAERDIAIHIQGNGTAIMPSLVAPDKKWILLITSRLRKVLSIAPENHLISLQCGVTYGQAEKSLREHEFSLAETGVHPLATIGGILAENLLAPGFPFRLPLASRVLNLTAMTANGEIFTLNSQTGMPGNLSAELPLAQVFCGSKGKIGLILDATFAVFNAPEVTSINFVQGSIDALLHISQQIFHASQPISSMLLDRDFGNLVCGKEFPALIFKISGSRAYVENSQQILEKICASISTLHPLAEKDLPSPHFLLTALISPAKLHSVNVLTAPAARVVALLEAVTAIARQYKLGMQYFGYPDLARIYFSFTYEKEEQWLKASKDIFALKLVLGNNQNLENSLGQKEEEWLENTAQLSKKIKNLFDPGNLFF